jgi:hypothetical protein
MTRPAAHDRRSPGVQRVPIATLVEICGQDGAVPAFEAESCNVSGLGMQVKTSYLPEIGDSLVCRFEHAGSEVLVEGKVAWRAEAADGGEFGIQFTALDAGSVDVLDQLGSRAGAAGGQGQAEEDETPRAGAEPGAKVRLHIEGLGAPMKARVQDGNARKVRVGSNLEFLKVGRTLEIEDVQAGLRQGAHVDSVSVTVNPSTRVPELVVVLRYEGADATPQPSVVESAHAVEDHGAEEEFEEELEGEEPAAVADGWLAGVDRWRQRLEGVALGASRAARQTQGVLGRVAGTAAEGASKLARGASAQLVRAGRSPERKRRTTAAHPAAARSPVQALKGVGRAEPAAPRRSARPGRPAAAEIAPAAGANRRRLAALGGIALLLAFGSAFAMRSLGDEPAPSLSQVAPHPAPASAPEKTSGAAPTAVAAKSATGAGSDQIVAEVPLFGPKAMATAEPAPLASPEEVDTAQIERLAAAAAVEDETWEDDKPEAPAPEASAADVKPWGRGKLHLPTIHRIRLDGPGGQIAGAVEATGFTVVIPGRKAMEEGRAIEKRDKRIAQVKASNTDRGASITFKFRGSVPAYRVRLRKDFVEFFISAPEGEAAKL